MNIRLQLVGQLSSAQTLQTGDASICFKVTENECADGAIASTIIHCEYII